MLNESKLKLCGTKVRLQGIFGNIEHNIYKVNGKYYVKEQGLSQNGYIGMYSIDNTLILYSKDYSTRFDIVFTSGNGDYIERKCQFGHRYNYGNDILNSLSVVVPNCKTYIGSLRGGTISNTDIVIGHVYNNGFYSFTYRPLDVDTAKEFYIFCNNTLYTRIENHIREYQTICIGKPIRENDKWVLADFDSTEILLESSDEIKFVSDDGKFGVICGDTIYDIKSKNLSWCDKWMVESYGKQI